MLSTFLWVHTAFQNDHIRPVYDSYCYSPLFSRKSHKWSQSSQDIKGVREGESLEQGSAGRHHTESVSKENQINLLGGGGGGGEGEREKERLKRY